MTNIDIRLAITKLVIEFSEILTGLLIGYDSSSAFMERKAHDLLLIEKAPRIS